MVDGMLEIALRVKVENVGVLPQEMAFAIVYLSTTIHYNDILLCLVPQVRQKGVQFITLMVTHPFTNHTIINKQCVQCIVCISVYTALSFSTLCAGDTIHNLQEQSHTVELFYALAHLWWGVQ